MTTTKHYITGPRGGTFQDIINEDPDNYTTEINVSANDDQNGKFSGFSIDTDHYPYGKYDIDGNENSDFETMHHSMTLEELTAYRDMLTEIIDNTNK